MMRSEAPPFDTAQLTYQRFRRIYSERTRSVVVWAGAGLSMPANLPSWKELRILLQEEVKKKAETLEPDDRNQLEAKLRAVRGLTDHWLAFERLKELLGRSSYEAAIRSALTPAVSVPVPPCYSRLWRLRIRGMLTLSIDRLATRAYTSQTAAPLLNELTGREIGRRIHVLKSELPYVVNLHGIVEDSSSWVLTKAEIRDLLADAGYRTFLHSIFATQTVVFMGISADDIAAGGILGDLRKIGLDVGEHFWLTDRRDHATDCWAEDNGIQIIRYVCDTSHDKAMDAFLSDLERFVSEDDLAPPVSSRLPDGTMSLPEPSELAGRPPDEIRRMLSSHAARILESSTQESIAQYEEFCSRYARAIHNSWYVSERPPENRLFGYEIQERIGEGAFGRVYRARAANGEEIAIKLLRQEVRDHKEMLGCFRRGVRSMRILHQRGVEGMVPYREAYELPPCVLMDLVGGVNLEEAVQSRRIGSWSERIRIALDICEIVRRGHLLPERVLHRDIRPPNVMLRDFYQKDARWEVVVLDFDLSWHLGSIEKSIADIGAGTALGYLAPEQLAPFRGVSTRSTAVDSYGLAMTIKFLFTGGHPVAGQSGSKEWEPSVRRSLLSHECREWPSAPVRMARLIARSTHPEQSHRLDMGHVHSELSRLAEAIWTPAEVASAELWAEEIVFGAVPSSRYDWDPDRLSAKAALPTGWEIEVRGDEVRSRVILSSRWASGGQDDRRRIHKYLSQASEKAAAILRRGGWQTEPVSKWAESMSVFAVIPIAELYDKREAATRSLAEHLRVMQLP